MQREINLRPLKPTKELVTTNFPLCKAIETYKRIGSREPLFTRPKKPTKGLTVANLFVVEPPNLNNLMSIVVVDFSFRNLLLL
jgi:hypothetical protein